MCFIFRKLFKGGWEMQTHLWYGFQVINVNDSQVYCVGNFSNNRLTTAQIDSSRGSWQTAALSVGILKEAKRPLQRQLGKTYWRRNLTTYWWQIDTAQECHMTPICLRATWRLSSRQHRVESRKDRQTIFHERNDSTGKARKMLNLSRPCHSN